MPQLAIGDPAPWFVAPTPRRSNFHFNTVAGRYVVLCFVESLADSAMQAMAGVLARRGELFNDQKACIFFVTCDPQDAASGRLPAEAPGRPTGGIVGAPTAGRVINRIAPFLGVERRATTPEPRPVATLDENER